VIQFAPESGQAEVYRTFARKIMENRRLDIPTPLEMEDLEDLAYAYST
jgi:nitrogenase iron protein NifH